MQKSWQHHVLFGWSISYNIQLQEDLATDVQFKPNTVPLFCIENAYKFN